MSLRAVKSFARSAVGACGNILERVLPTRHYEPGDTHRYIWQKSPDAKLSYVIYRTVHALLMLILLIISFFHVGVDCPYTKENAERYTCFGKYAQINPAWPFYLTRWGLVLNFVQALMGLISVVKAYRGRSQNQPETNVELNSELTVQNLPEHVQNPPESTPGSKKSKDSTVSGKKSAKTPGPVQNLSEAVQNPPDFPIAPKSTPGTQKSKNLTASGKKSANTPGPVQNSSDAIQNPLDHPIAPESTPGSKKSKNLTASGKKSANTPGPVQNTSEAVQNPLDHPIAPESTPGTKKSKNLTASGKTSAKTPGPVENSSESVPSTEGNKAGQESHSRPSPRLPEHSLLTFTGIYWSIHSVATTLTVIIDVVYWSILHNYSMKVTVSLFYYVSEHAVNLVLMSIDSFVVAFPMMLLHIPVLLIVGVLYSVVNLLYYIAGGLDQKFRDRFMYPFLNWEYPVQAIGNMSGVSIFTIIILLLLILLDIRKHRCFRRRSATTRRRVSTSTSRIDAV